MKPRRIVLLVEDDPETREALQTVLELEGHDVLVAEHGEEALERMQGVTPDIILLDMRMPVMDGRAFARIYREQPGPHAPIIVLTAAADAFAAASEVGAVGTVPKPFGVRQLLDAMNAVLPPP